MSPVGLIAILAGVWTRHDIVQSLVCRADELIFFGIIRKMVGTILVFEGFFYLSKLTGIMVEGVVFEIHIQPSGEFPDECVGIEMKSTPERQTEYDAHQVWLSTGHDEGKRLD